MDDATERAFLRIASRLEDEENAPDVIPACPPWCTLQPGHLDFYRGDDGSYIRTHDAYVADAPAWISSEERSDGQGGPVTLTDPAIQMDCSDYRQGASPAALRALAAQFLEVAALHESLTTTDPSAVEAPIAKATGRSVFIEALWADTRLTPGDKKLLLATYDDKRIRKPRGEDS